MRQPFISKRFNASNQALVERCDQICRDYAGQGFDLTLRQLYYQLVARDIIPNTLRSYKHLGGIINDARLAGMIDWNHISDRTRNLQANSHWGSPSSIIDGAAYSYRRDKWATQQHRVEVWIEKDALVGVLDAICPKLDVDYFSCRGYTSQSELYRAAKRVQRYIDFGQTPVVIHLGDHDPSGKDMTRDIADRFSLFMGGIEVNRIALNMDQIEAYMPPPNPAKLTDSRAQAYIAEFGDDSWELDALEPQVLTELIDRTVKAYRDEDRWRAQVEIEEHERRLLENVSSKWTAIAEKLESGEI